MVSDLVRVLVVLCLGQNSVVEALIERTRASEEKKVEKERPAALVSICKSPQPYPDPTPVAYGIGADVRRRPKCGIWTRDWEKDLPFPFQAVEWIAALRLRSLGEE